MHELFPNTINILKINCFLTQFLTLDVRLTNPYCQNTHEIEINRNTILKLF